MGVYLSGINMPKGEGSKLVLQIFPNGEVYDEHGIRLGITNWAKAVPVPEPHGRLGDLDELHKEAVRRSVKAGTHDIWYNCADRVICALDIKNAPTIIPAKPEEEETK